MQNETYKRDPKKKNILERHMYGNRLIKENYGVATISRLLKMIGLVCKT